MHPKFLAGTLARLAFFCLLAVFIFTPHARADQQSGIKKVLVLFPAEGWSSPADRMIYNGMKAVFDQSHRQDVVLLGDVLDLYYLNSKETEQRRLADFFRTKYAMEKIDVVVPVAPASVEFLLRYRDIMFPGIPVVFCAHSAYELHRLERGSDVTGVAATVDIAGTIDLARNLQPGLRRLAVIAGAGPMDLYLTSLVLSIFEKNYAGQLERIDLLGLTMDELLQRVSQLPESTAILFLNFSKDGAERPYVPAEAMQMVSKSTNAPLYNLLDTALGYGTVGGRLTTIEAYGRETAVIVLRVLSGEKAASIEPVVMSDNPPMFDWRELKRWKIDENALPQGSTILFRETSLWEVYKWWVIGAFSFICLQTLFIALLMNNLDKRKRAEANLRRAQEIASIGSLYYNIQEDAVSWSAGANEIFGLPPDSGLTYEAFLQVVHPEDREQVLMRWRAALEGETYDLEHRILVGGMVRWVRAKFEVKFDKRGKPLAATGSVQDITPRKRLEEETSRFRQQLAHVSRVSTVGELGQNLAHEINQPLATILANAEAAQQLLADEPPELKEASEAIDDIVSANKQAQEVIRRIRNLVKEKPLEHKRIDLNRAVEGAVQVVRVDAASKGVTIHLNLESDLPQVTGDEVQLQQVVLNLVINAMEALCQNHFPQRLVTIKTDWDGEGTVSLWVSDIGAGIDQKTMKRIFEPFFTNKPQGLGLGLSISRSIVEAHGGSLSVTSSPNKGATFCCRLPAVSAEMLKQAIGGPDHVS
jgi:PAS domain S-box-containing protein